MKYKKYYKNKITELVKLYRSIEEYVKGIDPWYHPRYLDLFIIPYYREWYCNALEIIEKFNPEELENFKLKFEKIENFFFNPFNTEEHPPPSA